MPPKNVEQQRSTRRTAQKRKRTATARGEGDGLAAQATSSTTQQSTRGIYNGDSNGGNARGEDADDHSNPHADSNPVAAFDDVHPQNNLIEERSSDDEEEDGEDLFGDDYMRDYVEPDVDSDGNEIDDDEDHASEIIDDRSEVSEISDSGRMAIDSMLERRREIESRRAATVRRREKEVGAGVFSDGDDGSDTSGLWGSMEEDTDSEYMEGPRQPGRGAADASSRRRQAGGRWGGPAACTDEDDGEGEGSAARGGGEGNEDCTADEMVGLTGDPSHRAYVQGELEAMGFDWKRPQCNLSEWLTQELPRMVIKNRIYNFFLNFVERGTAVYEQKVRLMTRDNACSFLLSYSHLSRVYESVLALWLVDLPEIMIELFEEAANFFAFRLYPHYRKVHSRVFVRICDMPICDPIRDFRQVHMNVLVRVEGVVIRRSPVYPQMQAVKYDCVRCSFIIGPIYQRGDKEQKVSMCPSCHGKGPFRVNMALTEYRNHQTIVLQEPPGKVPPGRLPRSLEVVLVNDLIDQAKPGEEVDVTGVYKNSFDPILNSRQGFPVFTTVLHANNITRKTAELSCFRLPDDEKAKILELARHPSIKRKLVCSIAPSIHGREDIKLGLLLAMMGGVPKDVGGDQSHRIRGDINILLVGDPGCAKSQFLKFVEKTADRSVFTTGRGSTAVGLTASVHKDSVTGDFVLEGGALVIADRGVCLIDEFDKMSDQDRTSIHEAMEQQTISVARGGIVTTLSARCCIIAAANPIGGRYDPSVSFDSNVNLTTPILSRFDLLYVVRDEVNVELDEQLATFICRSHISNHPLSQKEAHTRERMRHEELSRLRLQYEQSSTSESERSALEEKMQEIRNALQADEVREDDDPSSAKPLPQSLLRKYLLYAKAHCNPRISNIDGNTIAQLYTELRQESRHGGIAITVRHMESVIRLSEAHARLHLREFVRDGDVSAAIALFLRCFIQTQKYSMRGVMESRFRRYLESDTEPLQLIHHRLRVAVQSVRAFERQISGGVEPATVRIEVSELDQYTACVSTEALNAFFNSAMFKREYRLIRDSNSVPMYIEHML